MCKLGSHMCVQIYECREKHGTTGIQLKSIYSLLGLIEILLELLKVIEVNKFFLFCLISGSTRKKAW